MTSRVKLQAVSLTDDLTVVVTHHRTPALLADCLRRLADNAPGVGVLVVNTGPWQEELVALEDEFAEVKMVQAPNHSLANAVNLGLKRVATPFVLQMNADVLLEPETLLELLGAMRDPEVGMVGPRCRTPAGKWQDQGLLYHPYYTILALSNRSSVRVPWLSGCCQLLRLEAVRKVGGMDSSLRFYNEDSEWCMRLRRSGYRCVLSRAPVLHVGGASTPSDGRFVLEGLRGGMVLSNRYRTRLARSLHRWAVLLYARMMMRFARQAAKRKLYGQVYKMFSTATFADSPFGATLDATNPTFLASRFANASAQEV